jgi:glucose-1-phosphatase
MQKNYKAIVFDFGNVIININLDLTYAAFAALTFKSVDKVKSIFEADQIFKKYECGFYSDEEFRDVIRQSLAYPLNDNEIDTAWNALLLDVPKHRLEYIEKLRLSIPVYLLSNTNSLHIKACQRYFRKQFGYQNFLDIFKKAYLSYELGLWKPDPRIYQTLIEEIACSPEQILFIDDNLSNIEAAKKEGISVLHIVPPQCFTHLL